MEEGWGVVCLQHEFQSPIFQGLKNPHFRLYFTIDFVQLQFRPILFVFVVISSYVPVLRPCDLSEFYLQMASIVSSYGSLILPSLFAVYVQVGTLKNKSQETNSSIHNL